MTDFFAELEGHLHDAARRRARRWWLPAPRVTFAVVAAAASVAGFAVLGTLDSGRDPEVTAPAVTPALDSSEECGDQPPQEVLDRFAVLRQEATEVDRPPKEVLDRLDQDFPGAGRPAKVWPRAGRLARTIPAGDVWLFPVLLGKPCGSSPEATDAPVQSARQPGVCWARHSRASATAMCLRLRDAQYTTQLFGSEGRTPYAVALVPDGRRAVPNGGGDRVKDSLEGNVYLVTGAHDVMDVEPSARPGCRAPELSEEPPPPALLEIVPDFRSAPFRMPPDDWRDALAGQSVAAHVGAGRGLSFRTSAAMSVAGVPYTPLPERCGIDEAPTEAGVCLILLPRHLRREPHCFTGTQIAGGRALVHDEATGFAYGLVPAGTRTARAGGQEMEVEGSFAFTVVADPVEVMELTR